MAASEAPARPLVEVDGLGKVFPVGPRRFIRQRRGAVVAVDDVSLEIARGEILGLVGESGSGKTTLGRLVLRLVEPTRGRVVIAGTDVTRLAPGQLRAFRRHMQTVFQDPLASLNPRMSVRDLVGEPLRVHGLARTRKEVTEQVADLLGQVGLGPQHVSRYPHEFSGGQRQRICIARALAPRPSFIVADEPLSALDVSVQAQIVNLLLALREDLGLAFLFISHALTVVSVLADRIAVMYLGRIVELGPARAVYGQPLHPYTRALLAAVPLPDPARKGLKRPLVAEELPSGLSTPSGCAFHPRCALRVPLCREERPLLRELAPGRLAACHEV